MTEACNIIFNRIVSDFDPIFFGIWSVLMVWIGFRMGRKTLVLPAADSDTGKAVNPGSTDPGVLMDDPWEAAQHWPTDGRITGDLEG